MAYADFAYYSTDYHGTLPEADFTRLADRATEYIDSVTFDRINSTILAVEKTAARIKTLCCILCDLINTDELGGGLTSENNDGYSVSYAKGVTNTKTFEQQKNEATIQYLGSTGLLFRGI